MGWVTLTLRKTELKGTHADYQKELLGISREKRQKARYYHQEQLRVRTAQNRDLRNIKETYDQARQAAEDNKADDGSNSSDIQNQLDDARLAYEEQYNEAKNRWEMDLEIIENEANDVETELDQQQVQVEAQLEAISAEIEAVGQAVSAQVKASTIKLS